MIEYCSEADLQADEFVDLLERSTLAERRPVDNRSRVEAMLRGANVIVCARDANTGVLVGVSRAITDHAYCTYLSDLAVDQAYQRQGIGRRLIEWTHRHAGLATKLVLLAAPAAQNYYPHIGMESHPSCWLLQDDPEAFSPLSGVSKGSEPLFKSEQDLEADSSTSTSPGNERLTQFFDSLSSQYAGTIRRCVPRYDEMLAKLFEYLPSEFRPARILELGCGIGNLTAAIEMQYPQATITAVDLSAQSIEVCRERLSGSQHEFLSWDMRDVDFKNASFDLILSTISIHHLKSDEKRALFDKCFRWLTPGGIMSFSDQFSGQTEAVYQQHIHQWKCFAESQNVDSSEWSMWMQHQAEHDHHDALLDQMLWLREAGFAQVDCTWRNLLWAILLANKPPAAAP